MALVEKSAAIGCVGETTGASSARQNEPRKDKPLDRGLETVRRVGRDAARAHVLGAHGEADGSARRERDAVGDAKLEGADLDGSGPGHDGVEESHVPDEIGDERRRRKTIDLLRRADLVDHALVHDDDAVGHGERLLLVVRHHDGGDAEAALQRADLIAQAHAHLGVEGGERLVEEEQARRGRERARQRHALLLPAGELHRIFVLLVGQADEGEQLVDPALDLGARAAPVDEPVSDVPADRQVREKRVGLEDDAEVALGGRRVGHVAPGRG